MQRLAVDLVRVKQLLRKEGGKPWRPSRDSDRQRLHALALVVVVLYNIASSSLKSSGKRSKRGLNPSGAFRVRVRFVDEVITSFDRLGHLRHGLDCAQLCTEARIGSGHLEGQHKTIFSSWLKPVDRKPV